MIKKLSIVLIITLIAQQVVAQVNIQAFGSFVRNLNPDYKSTTYGGGVRVELGENGATFSKYFGFGYNLAIKKTKELEARAFTNFMSPETMPVIATYTLPMYRLEAGGRFYFIGEQHEYDGINLYGNIGLEVIVMPNKPTYSEYDKSLYHLGYTDDSDVNIDGSEKVAINLMLGGGFGIEKNVGNACNIFLQTFIALPATNSGNSDLSSSIEDFSPVPLNINLGIKLPLGAR